LFGVSKVIAERLEKSSQYKNVKKVYSVNIVFFDLGHGEDYVYQGTTNFYGIHKSDKLELNEQQKAIYEFEKVEEIFPEYYILKVEQFDNNTRDSLDEWIYFLKNEKIKENSMAKGLKEAEEKLNILKMNGEDRRKYDGYVEELRLELSIVESSYGIGKMEGREEGIQEGIKKGIHLVAENMLKTGVEEEIIIKATGLTLEQLKSIKNGSDK
jgi:predicted transposase/invertase (TIGR01784 family)